MEALAYRKNAVMVPEALPLVLGEFSVLWAGEAALGEELLFRSRRDVPANLTRIKEFKPYFKSASGSS